MKRTFDILFGLLLLLVLLMVFILISLAVKYTSKGGALFWSKRIGKNNKVFYMPKFRSMVIDTPDLASHLMPNPQNYLSPIGGFLRRSSLDELPQIFSVLKGDMSFVGPRPALFNQDDLIKLRSERGIDKLTPGITGWAQVNGRDELSIEEKVQLDEEYLTRKSFWFDTKILLMTALKVFKSAGISH